MKGRECEGEEGRECEGKGLWRKGQIVCHPCLYSQTMPQVLNPLRHRMMEMDVERGR